MIVLLGVYLLYIQNQVVQLHMDENKAPVLFLKLNDEEKVLKPWLDRRDGIYYFFLPSFVKNQKVYLEKMAEDNIVLDGQQISEKSYFQWQEDNIYQLEFGGKIYPCVFMKSSNIPSLFVDTESGSMEALNNDKEHAESGDIWLVNQNKNVEYHGQLKKISARGNSTFDDKEKKAYSISLNGSYPLCGMDAGKKWNLLAMYFEYDKIHTKIVYDMADVLEMEYNIDCTWVDLYCNGQYQGLYLLTEAVTVGEGRVDIRNQEKESEESDNITGGYLIEKDIEKHLEDEGNGFITEKSNYPFIVKNPNPATEEQMEYISTYIQNIENMLVEGDKKYKQYIDLDSFAKQFLIDKIVLEPDAMHMSTFYYKETDRDKLKVGPLWDYDRAFGGTLPDYSLSIGDYPDSMSDWYMELYEDEEFKNKMITYYRRLLPFFEEMLNGGIDAYAEFIKDAVKMDSVKWPNKLYQTSTMSYLEHDSYVQYLKYYLAKRLNYLNELWGISEWEFEVPASNEEEHVVQFMMDDGSLLESQKVLDGEKIEFLPELDGEKYSGWGFYENGKLYSTYIPIYEDAVLYAKRKFNSAGEQYAYKLERLNAAEDLLSYIKLLKDDDFSLCVYIEKNSELIEKEEILVALKEICYYKHPYWLDQALTEENDYFIIVDRGWGQIWSSAEGEELRDISTTFGNVNYKSASKSEGYLYIQTDEVNYLPKENGGNITFVVINRYTGEIIDISTFDDNTEERQM